MIQSITQSALVCCGVISPLATSHSRQVSEAPGHKEYISVWSPWVMIKGFFWELERDVPWNAWVTQCWQTTYLLLKRISECCFGSWLSKHILKTIWGLSGIICYYHELPREVLTCIVCSLGITFIIIIPPTQSQRKINCIDFLSGLLGQKQCNFILLLTNLKERIQGLMPFKNST